MKNDYLAEDVTKRAERVLMEWANISDAKTEKDKFRKRHPELFVGLVAGDSVAQVPVDDVDLFDGLSVAAREWLAPTKVPVGVDFLNGVTVATVRALLRKAWDAPDIRHREWLVYKLRERYWHWRKGASNLLSRISGKNEIAWSDDPPPLYEFERLMYHFHRIGDRARHCANPECPAPYYFTSKRGQRYCSSKCSAPAQRQAKLNWWREHGAKKRSEERAIAKKRKGRQHGER